MNKKTLTAGLAILAISAVSFGLLSDTPKTTTRTITTPRIDVELKDKSVKAVEKKSELKVLDINFKNAIFFNVQVDDESVYYAIEVLEEMRLDKVKTAYLFLDSPGGSVLAGAKLLSYIKASKMEII